MNEWMKFFFFFSIFFYFYFLFFFCCVTVTWHRVTPINCIFRFVHAGAKNGIPVTDWTCAFAHNELTAYSSLNMRSILLDGIIHWNPLPFYLIFVSLYHCLFLLEPFDWHVSHHLIPSVTQVSFCTTTSIMFFMLLLNCFPRSTFTSYICFCNYMLLRLPARIISSGLSSYAWPIMLKERFLQFPWPCSVFPYIYH